jgi:transcriptional regulator GlxA family with amidase domain
MTPIGIPLYDGVDLLDFAGPLEMFGWVNTAAHIEPGQEVDVRLLAEKAPGEIKTRADQLTVKVCHAFADVGQLDVLWVPGADPSALACQIKGADTNPTPLIRFLRAQGAGARFVCSVCEGAILLAAAGLLDGYEATTHWAFIPCLKQYRKVKVVDGLPRFWPSGNRLTGGGVSSGLDEALYLIELLTSREVAEDVQGVTQYFPDPPVCKPVEAPSACNFPGLGPGA